MIKGTRGNEVAERIAETTGEMMTGEEEDGRVRREVAEEEMIEEVEEGVEMMTEVEGGMVIGTGIGETETEIAETEDERGAPPEEVEMEVETWLQGFKVWLVLKGMEEDEWERGTEGEGWAMMEEEWEDPVWVMMVPEWVDLME